MAAKLFTLEGRDPMDFLGGRDPKDVEDEIQAIGEAVDERRRSEKRWRIATFVVAVLAVCISAASLIVTLTK
jgi:hypothetical protein